MAKLTIIVGMAGSGKSRLCKKTAEENEAKAFTDATLTSDDDDRRAGYNCLGEMVARLLGRGENCVMDESHLTVPAFRDKFKKFCDEFLKGVDQEWIFFEHNVVSCINNVFHDQENGRRIGRGRLQALEGQIIAYVIPPVNEFPRRWQLESVYRQEFPKFTDSKEALQWLRDEINRLTD